MEVIELRNGPTVPIEAWSLALELERLGYLLSMDGETLRLRSADVLRAPEPLTETQRAAIRHWKLHLLAIVAYSVAPVLSRSNKKSNKVATRCNIE